MDKGMFSLERIGERNPKIGIALGSGGARGMAHIGVLRALEEVGLKLEIVAGTSIGALVGGIYSAGKIDELTEIALGLDWKKAARYFMEVSFPRSGLIEGARINEFLLEMVGDRSIEDLPVHLRSCHGHHERQGGGPLQRWPGGRHTGQHFRSGNFYSCEGQ